MLPLRLSPFFGMLVLHKKPIEKDCVTMSANIIEIEERLWQMTDKLRANTPLRAHVYAEPVLGLIFL